MAGDGLPRLLLPLQCREQWLLLPLQRCEQHEQSQGNKLLVQPRVRLNAAAVRLLF